MIRNDGIWGELNEPNGKYNYKLPTYIRVILIETKLVLAVNGQTSAGRFITHALCLLV